MSLRIHNTLSRRLEAFEPIAGSLFREANESEEHARRCLETIVDRYFRTETYSNRE